MCSERIKIPNKIVGKAVVENYDLNQNVICFPSPLPSFLKCCIEGLNHEYSKYSGTLLNDLHEGYPPNPCTVIFSIRWWISPCLCHFSTFTVTILKWCLCKFQDSQCLFQYTSGWPRDKTKVVQTIQGIPKPGPEGDYPSRWHQVAFRWVYA